MAGRPTRPEAALVAKRRTDALQLRMAGVDFLSIGKKLAADPAINTGRVAYPCGYGREAYEAGERPPSESKLAELAKNDVYRAMERRRTRMGEAADELRNMQDERLNRLLSALWAQAMQGDGNAVDRVLKVMERQARLNGLDAPVRTEVSGEGGAPIRIENALEADRAAAMTSVLSFRADKAESIEALKAIEGAGGEVDEDVAAGFGAGLDDEDEDDEPIAEVDVPAAVLDALTGGLTLGEGDPA